MAAHRLGLYGARAHYHYVQYLRDARGVQVVGVAETDPGRARAAAEYIRAPVLPGPEAFLADPSVDLVFLAVDPSAKAEAVERCAAAGKHVFMDKPFPADLDAIGRIERALAAAGTTLVVPYPHCRYNPLLGPLARDLGTGRQPLDRWDHKFLFHSTAGQVGKSISAPLPATVATGGECVNLGCYALDLALLALGLPQRVEARLHRRYWPAEYAAAGTEDSADIALDWGSTRGTLLLGRNCVPGKGFMLNRLALTGPGFDLLAAPYQDLHLQNGQPRPIPRTPAEGEACCEHFLDCAEGRDSPRSGIAAGRLVATLTTAIYQSAAHRRIISLPLADLTNPYLAGWRLEA